MSIKALSISSLLLDLENPRIVRAGSQRDALQRIIDEQDVRLAVLAESIVAQNGLNPMDRWLVLRQGESNKFIVYEGNRRLAALKILSNPAVLGGLEIKPALRKRFERAASRFDATAFGKVDCYEINSRAEGAQWLHQRHTGANQGRGKVDWSGLATARFRGADPALQALEAVKRFASLDEAALLKIEDRFPITTLDRLLSATAVRSMIGFDVKQGKLLTDLPPVAALRALTRLVNDLSGGEITVSDLKNKDQQNTYIQSLGDDLPDLSKRTGVPKAVEEWEDELFSSVGGSRREPSKPIDSIADAKKEPAAGRSKPSGRQKVSVRQVLIEKDCVLNVTNAKIREIEQELRILQLASHRHAIAVLFRVFLETSVDSYLTSKGIDLTQKDKGGHVKDKSLGAKVDETIAAMVASGVPKKNLDGVAKGIRDRSNAIYIETLHAYVHNQFYSPKESDLTVAFDNARPFFGEIWK